MRRYSGVLLAVFVLASTSPAVSQGSPSGRGYYLEGAGGVNFLRDSDGFYTLRPDHPNPALRNLELPSSTAYDRGWGISGRLGYAWRSGFRADLELAYRRNKVDHSDFTATNGVIFFPATDTGPTGHARSVALMLNGYYDFINSSSITPYIGLGVGAVNVGGNYRASFEPITQHYNSVSDSDWGIGAQAIAGVSFALTRQLSLIADYRFLRAFDISTSEQQFPPNTGFQTFAAHEIGGKGEYDNHTVMVGLRYTFGN